MVDISVNTIEKVVYELCFQANTCLDNSVYSKIKDAYINSSSNQIKSIFSNILKNAKIAYENKRPLCQDTGQVLVFLEIGQEVHFTDGNLTEAINRGTADCYLQNFFRKSVVKNALFDRQNTKNNTPTIIHTDIVDGECVKISVLIKGAGSENKSQVKMLLPTSSKEDIKNYIKKTIVESGTNSCPPLFVGVGIGGTIEEACILSKKALLKGDDSQESLEFAKDIKSFINENSPEQFTENYVLNLNLKTAQTHIACLPVAITINCHSSREATAIVKNNSIEYLIKEPEFININEDDSVDYFNIDFDKTQDFSSLKINDKILFSGEIIVARDAAHKKLIESIKNNTSLPFDLKGAIIFYAGPCPAKAGEVIGPIGPTTSSRMDKYAPILYDKGIIATIGKGERSPEVIESIRKNKAAYFTVQGGIACFLASKIKKAQIIAFEELGAEAIYKIEVHKLPLKVSII